MVYIMYRHDYNSIRKVVKKKISDLFVIVYKINLVTLKQKNEISNHK